MAVIAAIATAVWTAVATVATAVVNVITAVITPIISAVTKVIGWVTNAVTTVANFLHITQIVGALKPLWNIVSIGYSVYNVIRNFQQGKITAGITGVVGAIGTIYSLAGGTLKEYIGNLYESFQGFAQAIQLEVVLQIHDIAYLVSEDYRQSMEQVYVQVGKVSKALGFGAEFFTLLLRDAKEVIQDTAALMGRTYDVGEITWLKTMEDFFKVFGSNAKKYEKNPGALIYDIDQYLMKPAQDNKAIVFQNLYGIIESVIASSKQVIETVETVRGDMDTALTDMPANIRKEIDPYITRVFGKYDNWIATIYQPAQMTITLAMKRHGDNVLRLGNEVYELVKYVENPAKYLARLMELSEEERAQAQSIIAELVLGRYEEYGIEWKETVKPQTEWLDRIRGILKSAIPYPAWYVEEVETPQRPADTPVEPRKTWNVGDY